MIAKLTSQTHRNDEIKLQVDIDSAGPDELFPGKELSGDVVLSRGDGGKIVATISIAEVVKITEEPIEAQRTNEAAS